MEDITIIVAREPVPGIIVLDTVESNEINFQADDPIMIIMEAHDVLNSLPIASSSRLGGIKVGANLSIDENGVLNALGGGESGAGEWGSIAGTITDQVDLMAYLNAKAPINSPTFTGIVTIPSGAIISSTHNAFGLLNYQSGGSQRWSIGKDDTAQGGANTGADFAIYHYDDAGILLGEALKIKRSDGEITIENNLSVTGTSYFTGVVSVNNDIGSPSFASGFAGSGWKLDYNTDYSLTVDNLIVRKGLNVYELIINQIRGTNGSLWVSDSAKIDRVDGDTCYIDTDDGNLIQPFAVNDIIRCQKFTGRGIKYYSAQVTAIDSASGEWFKYTVIDGTDSPGAGDEVVRIGNTSDTSRQGALYLTSSDTGAPYMDILDGVTSYSFTGKMKARLGKLSGITDSDFGGELSGYGLYSTNVYLKGSIVLPSAGITNEGAISTSVRIYAGESYTNRSSAPFRVTQNGSLTAKGIAELGTATADYGGGIYMALAIKNADLYENARQADDGCLYLNSKGCDGLYNYYRDTIIGNGKGESIMSCSGSNKCVTIHQGLQFSNLSQQSTPLTLTAPLENLYVCFDNDAQSTLYLPSSGLPGSGTSQMIFINHKYGTGCGAGKYHVDGNGFKIYKAGAELTSIDVDEGHCVLLVWEPRGGGAWYVVST